MNTFPGVFLFFYSLYGTAHLYAFLKIKHTFSPGAPAGIVLGVFLVLMTFSPSLIRLCSLRVSTRLSKVVAYAGYIWMALLFFFFSGGLTLDIYSFIVRQAAVVLQKDLSGMVFSARTAFFLPLFLAVPFSIYGYFEARNLRVKRLTVKTPKLAGETGRLKIVHISDLHLGLGVNEGVLEQVIKKIEEACPDLIVSTGDLLEEEVNHVRHLAEKLSKVPAGLGKFAVTGNHDFFVDIKHSLEFMENAGFRVLRGDGVTLRGMVNIAGVDDPIVNNLRRTERTASEREILSGFPRDVFTILLKHRPEIDRGSLGLFDLQLSGHTHGGQFFPVNFLIMLFFRHKAGFKRFNGSSALYVSRGAGTACSSFRFLVPPEMTVIEVVPAK